MRFRATLTVSREEELPAPVSWILEMDEEVRVSVVLCKMCDFHCFDSGALIKHARDVNENDPNFILYCGKYVGPTTNGIH